MTTWKRKLNHKSCRVKNRGGIGPKGSNNAKQTQIATVRFERWGVMIGRPQGHKRYGWYEFPERRWEPANEKLQTVPNHVPMYEQLKLIRGSA